MARPGAPPRNARMFLKLIASTPYTPSRRHRRILLAGVIQSARWSDRLSSARVSAVPFVDTIGRDPTRAGSGVLVGLDPGTFPQLLYCLAKTNAPAHESTFLRHHSRQIPGLRVQTLRKTFLVRPGGSRGHVAQMISAANTENIPVPTRASLPVMTSTTPKTAKAALTKIWALGRFIPPLCAAGKGWAARSMTPWLASSGTRRPFRAGVIDWHRAGSMRA